MRLLLLPTLVGLLLLAGCGQKGPLYIPKDDSPKDDLANISTAAKTNAAL
jgi:predicted small lipoprotein YifL